MRVLSRVIVRETYRIVKNPTYWFAIIILPLFTLLVLSTIFNNGLIRELPIGVVDNDNGQLSRSIIQDIESVPELSVKKVYINTYEAQNDILRKDIYGYLIIPHNFEKNIVSNKATQIPFYYHYALLSVGGEVLSGFYSYLSNLATLPLQNIAKQLDIDKEKIKVITMPISADFHPLNNPSLDYEIYLSFTYFYVLFQIIILLTIAYSIGREFKEDNANEWLYSSHSHRFKALFGKLLPYFVSYSIIACFGNYVLFYVINIPLASSFLSILFASVLFIAASISVSVFLFSIHPKLAFIISFISMFGSMSATMVGVTFPVTAMPPIINLLSNLFPARHFTVISQNLCYENLDIIHVWKHYAALFIFLFLPLISTLKLFPNKLLINRKNNSNEKDNNRDITEFESRI